MNWVKCFLVDLFGAQIDGFRFARGMFWLFALMAAWEFGQHVIEVRIGFFDSAAASKAVAMDATRMALGWVKMILVYAGGFFAIRYLLWSDARRAVRVSGGDVLRYTPYFLYSMAMFALVFYAGSLVAPGQVMTLRLVASLTQIALEPALMLWIVASATGGPVGNPWQSVRITGWWYFWAFALFFIGRIPINAAHQLLNRYAIGQPPALVWTMLAIDALVVGLLVAIVPALYVRVYRLVMARRGVVI
jgi:hypothetical protein